jgi:hypothetical protein
MSEETDDSSDDGKNPAGKAQMRRHDIGRPEFQPIIICAAGSTQMSTFRFLPAPALGGSMGSDMAQEAFMTWNQVETNWWQLKNKFVFGGFRLSGGDSQRSDRSGLELSTVGQSAELQPAAFRPDDRGRRSEFSLHIGC